MSASRIPSGGTRGTVYRAVAEQRMDDAQALLNASRYNGAVYLAGYAVECHLKYAYCERKAETYLPARYETHVWEILVEASGLITGLRLAPKMFDLYSALITEWGPSLRYSTKSYRRPEASRLYKELLLLYQFLRDLVP